MKTIKDVVTNEIVINKSKFIVFLYPVSDEDEINCILNDMRKKYYDATHVCYAYVLENKEKFSDDGEPSGTSGMPMMTIIKKHNLTNVLAIVIRYFGGIKLGSGGLIRAYGNAVSQGILKAQIKDFVKGNLIEITFPYIKEKVVNQFFNKEDIVDKKFEEDITYIVKVSDEQLEKIRQLGLSPIVIKEIYL